MKQVIVSVSVLSLCLHVACLVQYSIFSALMASDWMYLSASVPLNSAVCIKQRESQKCVCVALFSWFFCAHGELAVGSVPTDLRPDYFPSFHLGNQFILLFSFSHLSL